MSQKTGQFTARFEVKVPPAHKVRLAIAKPLLFIAQWLIGAPITITAVADAAKPETIVRVPSMGPSVFRAPRGPRFPMREAR